MNPEFISASNDIHKVYIWSFLNVSYLVFYDDVITGQDDVIKFWFAFTFKILGWIIIWKKNFQIWTTQGHSGISQNPLLFKLWPRKNARRQGQIHQPNMFLKGNRLRWIRIWGQIWRPRKSNGLDFIFARRHWRYSDFIPGRSA